MKKFEVIEDNGGGLTLVVFATSEETVEYIHTGYEYYKGSLMEDLANLKNDANPAEEWDGNMENPQEVYESFLNAEGWEVVADNDGIYPDRMGLAACAEFGVEKL